VNRDVLIEEVASGWRPKGPDGEPRSSPAWHDLDEAGRVEACAVAYQLRQIEAALDPEGLSSTARNVLAAITKERDL
jgi:hypothetical protein